MVKRILTSDEVTEYTNQIIDILGEMGFSYNYEAIGFLEFVKNEIMIGAINPYPFIETLKNNGEKNIV